MRISDWSSDVCSSDLLAEDGQLAPGPIQLFQRLALGVAQAEQLLRQKGLAGETGIDLVQQAAAEQNREAEAEGGLRAGQRRVRRQPLLAVERQGRGAARVAEEDRTVFQHRSTLPPRGLNVG